MEEKTFLIHMGEISSTEKDLKLKKAKEENLHLIANFLKDSQTILLARGTQEQISDILKILEISPESPKIKEIDNFKRSYLLKGGHDDTYLHIEAMLKTNHINCSSRLEIKPKMNLRAASVRGIEDYIPNKLCSL